ncbi:DUF2798 domain-containing protein [Marinomonas epiphytica]
MKFRVYFAVLMSCVLSFLMSGWITFINIGLVDRFFSAWMAAWCLAWPAAAVIAFLFAPKVQQISRYLADRF